MDSKAKRKLESNLRFLKQNIPDLDPIIDCLISKGTFRMEHREKVYSAPTNSQKINSFLDLLMRSGSRSYDDFIDSLRETNHAFVADELESTVTEDDTADDTVRTTLRRSTTSSSDSDNGGMNEEMVKLIAKQVGSQIKGEMEEQYQRKCKEMETSMEEQFERRVHNLRDVWSEEQNLKEQEKIEALTKELEVTQENFRHLQIQQGLLKERLEKKTEKMLNLKRTIELHKRENESLQEAISQKDGLEESIANGNYKLYERAEKVEQDLQAKELEYKELEREYKAVQMEKYDKDRQICELYDSLNEKNAEINLLRQEVSELRKRANDMKKKNEAIETGILAKVTDTDLKVEKLLQLFTQSQQMMENKQERKYVPPKRNTEPKLPLTMAFIGTSNPVTSFNKQYNRKVGKRI